MDVQMTKCFFFFLNQEICSLDSFPDSEDEGIGKKEKKTKKLKKKKKKKKKVGVGQTSVSWDG